MIVNVKLLNGDIISLEMNIYSQQGVHDSLRSYYNEGFFTIHHLHEYENGDKDVFAIVLPVHKLGSDFERVLNKTKRYLERHGQNMARKPIRSYFRRILRLLTGDDAIRGDSYVNDHQTALEMFTTFMLESEEDLLEPDVSIECTNRDIILDCYGKLCSTTTNFDKAIRLLCDLKIKDNYPMDYGFFVENRLVTRGRLLKTINHFQEIELFRDITEDLADEAQPTLTYNQILWLLKCHMIQDLVVND